MESAPSLQELHAEAAAAALAETEFLSRPAYGCSPALHYLAHELHCRIEVYEHVVQGRACADVVDRWLLWLLEEELKDYPTSAPVAALYRRQLAGDEPSRKEWAKAHAAADAADAATHARERMRTKLLELLS